MIIMVIALIFGLINLGVTFYQSIALPPNTGMLDLQELYKIFKLVLIIVVGYELTKSILIIIESDEIPAKTILSIAIIALANKIITLDLAHTGFETLLGLAAMVISLGASIFLLNGGKMETKKD